MQLTSFGCSVTFGTELSDTIQDPTGTTASTLTWPAIVAQRLDLKYQCIARGGTGNLAIADRVLLNRSLKPNDIFVINWTYIDRFDYIDRTIEPNARGALQYHTILPNRDDAVADFYYRNLHSEFRDKLVSLLYMRAVLDTLLQHSTRFAMTCLDPTLFCDQWHASDQILELQRHIKPHVLDFAGKTFLQWCKEHAYPTSAAGHPLDEAHRAAADSMLPKISRLTAKS